MATGSAKSLQVCKQAKAHTFNKTLPANSRVIVTSSAAGYAIPDGYTGIFAGFTGETTSTNSTTPFCYCSPRAGWTNNFVSLRNNAESTEYTRHIRVDITFLKSEFVDDRR